MKGSAIGIDIGGTKMAAGVVDLASGRVERQQRLPTPVNRGGEAVLAACVALAADLDASGDLPVGIAVPELVSQTGHIQSAYQFDWLDLDVAWAFHQRPVTVASDVRAAARAEARFGAGSGAGSLLYVSIGTGISSTFVLGGVPWAGSRGHALVLSSGDLAAIDPATGGVVRSVLEEWAAGPAIVRRYEAAGGEAGLSTAEVLALAAEGDDIATPLVSAVAEALGSAVGQAVNLLDPELVVIGGGLGLAGGDWWDQIVTATRRAIWSDQTRDLPIVTAGLGEEAGLVGAALETCTTPASEDEAFDIRAGWRGDRRERQGGTTKWHRA